MCNIYDDNRHVTTKLSYRRFPKWIRNWKIIFQKKILDNLVVVILALLIALEY